MQDKQAVDCDAYVDDSSSNIAKVQARFESSVARKGQAIFFSPRGVAPPKGALLARRYEPKLDGCRVLAGRDGDVCQVRTRGGGLVQRNVPEVVDAVRRLEASHVVLDGELVVVDEGGRCDFDAACARLRSPHGPPVTVFLFDVLALDGEDLRRRPFVERRRTLERVVPAGDPALRLVHVHAGSHRRDGGERVGPGARGRRREVRGGPVRRRAVCALAEAGPEAAGSGLARRGPASRTAPLVGTPGREPT